MKCGGGDGIFCIAMTAAGAHAILFTTGRAPPRDLVAQNNAKIVPAVVALPRL